MTMSWDDLVGDLEKRRDATLAMGGDERVDRQHAKGKLTVRERIGLLVDDGSFVEHGMLANHMDPAARGAFLAGRRRCHWYRSDRRALGSDCRI